MKTLRVRSWALRCALAAGALGSSCAVPATGTVPVAPAAGERTEGSDGFGVEGTALQNPLYDPATVQTTRGKILRVEQVESQRRTGAGVVQLVLEGGSGVPRVRIGPSWFVNQQDFELEPGTFVEVVGSRITLSGTEVLLAKSVLKGNLELRLRDESGIPVWLAVRQRR